MIASQSHEGTDRRIDRRRVIGCEKAVAVKTDGFQEIGRQEDLPAGAVLRQKQQRAGNRLCHSAMAGGIR